MRHAAENLCRDIDVKVATSIESLKQEGAAYLDFVRRIPDGRGIYYSFEWLEAMLELYCRPPREFLFLLAYRRGKLIGVAPFYLEKLTWAKGGVRRIGCWGSMQESLLVESDFLIPEVDDVDACLMGFRNYLFRDAPTRIDCLDLRYFREESNSKEALIRNFPGISLMAEGMDSYQITLPATIEDYSQSRSKSMMKQTAKHDRALARDFGYVFELKNALADGELEQIAALHARRQDELARTGRSRTSLFASEPERRCYLRLLAQLSSAGLSRFYLMKVSDRIVAFLICFPFEGTLVGHLTAFDSDYAKYSLGRLIHFKAIESEIALGSNRTIDLMPGVTKIKTDFCDVVRPRWRLILVNSYSPISVAKVAAWKMAGSLAGVVKRWRNKRQ